MLTKRAPENVDATGPNGWAGTLLKLTSRTGVPKDALKLSASRRTRKMSRVIRGLEKHFSPMSSGEDKECEMPDRIAQNSRTTSSPGRPNFDADVSTSPVESSVV